MELLESIKDLGNVSPSLSLIVSLIVGASIISVGLVCKASATNKDNCKTLRYVGAGIIVAGTTLFYFARDTDLAMWEGLWILVCAATSGYLVMKAS